ncbi:MAG: hypothetical protein ABSG74_13675 [Candidatus Bathyarchaeia archaeon]
MKTTRARRAPNWETWLKSPGACQQSLRYFETHAQIRRLNVHQAEADVLGHMKKAFHNLSLANQIFDSNQKNQLQVSYSGENYYDWVITVSYYSMYQACLSALAAVRKSGENHSATVCALVFHYVHKRKQLNEQYLLSLDKIQVLADQDVQKLVERRFQREKASYDTGYTTQVGLAQTTLTEAREFVLKVREILEDALGKDFMKGV